MARTKTIAGVILAVVVLAGCSKPRTIRVASKNFTEQVILGEIIAQHIEHKLQYKVDRRLNLGGTMLAQQALANGQIDLYPEYTGTALSEVLKQRADGGDAAAVRKRVQAAYLSRFHVEWLLPLGFEDTFAMVIPGPLARTRRLETLSDAAVVAEPWSLGVGYEFQQRPDGMAALDQTYRMKWKGSPKTMDLGLLYKAIEQGQVNMIAANSTDGLLTKMDLKILADDKHAFPPYEVCIAVRQESLSTFPGLREALDELSGKFTDERMQKLNYAVDGEHRPVAIVAGDFLKMTGLQ